MLRHPSPEFNSFANGIERLVREHLARTNPTYVQAVERLSRENPGDLDKVICEAKPLLGNALRRWTPLLECINEIELARDRMWRSLQFLNPSIHLEASPADQGSWTDYHFSQWLIQRCAFLDLTHKLICQCCRQIVQPKNRSFKALEETLLQPVDTEKKHFKYLRDIVPHGANEPLAAAEEWAVYVVLSDKEQRPDLLRPYYESIAPLRESWFWLLEQSTEEAMATIDAAFRELSNYTF